MSYAPSYPQPGYPGQAAHHPPQPPHHSYPGPGGPAPAPPQSSSAPAQSGSAATTGQVEGAQFKIDHRDSNSMLYLRLQPGYEIKAKPGSMVAMDATVQIKGKLKFSLKKVFTGGDVRIFPALRAVALATHHMNRNRCRSLSSPALGRSCSRPRHGATSSPSILTARPTGPSAATPSLPARTVSCGRRRARVWAKRSVSTDHLSAHLHCLSSKHISDTTHLFRTITVSGEGLFVYQVNGAGVMWVQSLGAVTSRTLQPGEQWIGAFVR